MSIELLKAITASTRSPDEADGRVYGWIPGIVTDVHPSRPEVKARIGKQGDNETTGWMVQASPGGIESVPNVGDPVGVFFHDGDPHRGAYFYFPQSSTKGRPSDFMVLGTTLVGVINNLIDQVNQLRSDFVSHAHLGGSTVCANGAPWTGSTNPPTAGTGAQPVNKCKAADNTVVQSNPQGAVVLSGRAKVGV